MGSRAARAGPGGEAEQTEVAFSLSDRVIRIRNSFAIPVILYPQCARTIDPELRPRYGRAPPLLQRMGIYDFYRRTPTPADSDRIRSQHSERDLGTGEEMSPRKAAALVIPVATVAVADASAEEASGCPSKVSDPVKALHDPRRIRRLHALLLHKQGRKQIVFGVGNPKAELMFIGEAPGADEDEQGEPFVGRAGQLLNNMIKAMGIERERCISRTSSSAVRRETGSRSARNARRARHS